jgi:hypothetical protein
LIGQPTWVSIKLKIFNKIDLVYTTGEKAALFAIIAIGALLAIYPVYKGIQKHGCRYACLFAKFLAITHLEKRSRLLV